MTLIECENLTLGYSGKAVVSNLSFSIEQGDYFCIVGENGSGKSTLLKTLLGLQPLLDGRIIMKDGLEKNEIGYLPQQTFSQKDFPATVKEIVRSGCQNHCGLRPFYTTGEKQRAKEAMKKLHILSLSNRCYRELSGGQQQRVLLARALCATGRILFLDEPIAGLDPKASRSMYHLIWKLNQEDHITIVMVTHDIQAADCYASRVLHMGSGPSSIAEVTTWKV